MVNTILQVLIVIFVIVIIAMIFFYIEINRTLKRMDEFQKESFKRSEEDHQKRIEEFDRYCKEKLKVSR
jgi:ATP/ADP translocase